MKKILILGSYGRGNVGDDAFLYAAIKLFPNCEIYINSADDSLLPTDIRQKVKTISTTNNSDFFTKLRVLLAVTHVVYCGGDLWVELYGDRFPRMSLYKMAILNFALRLLGKKIAYIGVGAGKISGYSLLLAKVSAMLAKVVTVREIRTKELLAMEKVVVIPDLTINLFSNDSVIKSERSGSIGVSVMYYIPEPAKNYFKYLDDMSTLIEKMAANSSDRFVLIPMLISPDPRNDLHVCEELIARINPSYASRVSIMKYSSFHDFLSKLSDFDLVIGTRLHANILGVLSGVPSIGIDYRPKVSSFFRGIEMQDNVVTMEHILDIESRAHEILSNYAHHKKQVLEARSNLIEQNKNYEKSVESFLSK